MRKMVLGMSIALTVLGFCMSPAMAASRPHGAPTLSAFLASLATPAPVPAARHPSTLRGKSSCTASANCAFGGTVSCGGNNTCSGTDGNCAWNEVGHVTCDGTTYSCGGSCCPGNFCDGSGEDRCARSCYPCSYSYTCNYSYCFDDCECNYSTCPV